MTDDPIVEEARMAGKAYIESFHGDLEAVIADLQRRTEEARCAGREVVSLPPRPLEPCRQTVESRWAGRVRARPLEHP